MSATSVSSAELLVAIRQEGDSAAWARFCARYEPVLLAVARRSGLQESDARDVVQESLIAFLDSFRDGRYDGDRGRLQSWLAGIALNKIREFHRRPAARETQTLGIAGVTTFLHRVPDDAEVMDIFEEEWQRAVMTECLKTVRAEVDEQTFRAFELYGIQGLPAARVAEDLGMSRNAVYIAKNRVLARCRALRKEMVSTW